MIRQTLVDNPYLREYTLVPSGQYRELENVPKRNGCQRKSTNWKSKPEVEFYNAMEFENLDHDLKTPGRTKNSVIVFRIQQ